MAGEETADTAWTGVFCHRPYNPYRLMGQLNPAFRKSTDGRLLDFKDNADVGVTNAVADYRQLLMQLHLPRGTILVVVPGHRATASNRGKPLARAAERLAEDEPDRYLARPDVLVRRATVEKLAKGGRRDVEALVASLEVREAEALRGAVVVVLDDTTTTGSSIDAARRLLLAARAKRVAAVALGRTVKYL